MGIPFSPALPNDSFIPLRLYRNHSAFNSHNFPRPYTTTYPCSVCRYSLATKPPHHVRPLDSELTSSPPVVLTDWLPSLSTPSALRSLSMPFQLRALHAPLRDYSPPILPLCIQYIQPTYRVCTLHDPRRLRKVRDSNPRVIADLLLSREPPYHSANFPFYRALRFCRKDNHLNTFKSSYIPLAIFSAISC